MVVPLKRLHEQVVVVTGATSGIGLATARLAAHYGARLLLSSRNEEDLRLCVNDIRTYGGQAEYEVADVADEAAVKRIAEHAIRSFGRIDTWINNAGTAIYGRLVDVPIREKRRLFDVNFWGAVYGCKMALPHLRRQGGALINVGGISSERAIPIQGIYSASKHALKGYTDALRMELEHDQVPVSVTLIMPGAINTPSTLHAQNHTGSKVSQIFPVYAPEIVARAIVRAAEHPIREVYVGGSARLLAFMERFLPRLTDLWMERFLFNAQILPGKPPQPSGQHGLFTPPPREGQVEGDYEGRVLRSSLSTEIALRPVARNALLAAVGLAGLALLRRRRRARIPERISDYEILKIA